MPSPNIVINGILLVPKNGFPFGRNSNQCARGLSSDFDRPAAPLMSGWSPPRGRQQVSRKEGNHIKEQ